MHGRSRPWTRQGCRQRGTWRLPAKAGRGASSKACLKAWPLGAHCRPAAAPRLRSGQPAAPAAAQEHSGSGCVGLPCMHSVLRQECCRHAHGSSPSLPADRAPARTVLRCRMRRAQSRLAMRRRSRFWLSGDSVASSCSSSHSSKPAGIWCCSPLSVAAAAAAEHVGSPSSSPEARQEARPGAATAAVGCHSRSSPPLQSASSSS